MRGWIRAPLGEVTQFVNGLWKGEDPPFVHVGVIRNTNFTKEGDLDDSDIAYLDVEAKKFQKRRLQYGDLILEKSGGGPKQPVGRVVFFDKTEGDFSFSNFTAAIRVVDPTALDARFLHKYLHWVYVSGRTEAMQSHSTGIRNLNGDAYKAIKVAYPSVIEQRRIVAILDQAFEGIATAKANAEKNLRNARELLSAGLDAAILGILTKEWRTTNSDVKGASESLRDALANRHLEAINSGESGLPRLPVSDQDIGIPPGWTIASPEQLALKIVDCPHSTPKWTETGVLCLRTTNFKPGFLDLGSVQFVSEETYSERIARLEPQAGDVLYSREGGILGIACLLPPGVRACLGQRMMLFRLDSQIALPEYFAAVLNSRFILAIVRKLTGGAAAPHLNIRDIRLFPIPLPPVCEQQLIVKRLQVLSENVQRLEEIFLGKLAALDEMKKSLLHQAFTGTLTAKSTDRRVAEVA